MLQNPAWFFSIHPSFVVDAQSMIPYGFADVKVWNRGLEPPVKDKSHAKKLVAVSEKESYKWIESSIKAKKALSEAVSVIIVQRTEKQIFTSNFALYLMNVPICWSEPRVTAY